MIHKPATQLEADLAYKDSLVIKGATAAHYMVTELREAHRLFWSMQTERLLAVLNANIADTLAAFAGNTALATAANAQLDALDARDALGNPLFPTRAPTTPGRSDIVFNGTEFVYVPPPEPEPEPEA